MPSGGKIKSSSMGDVSTLVQGAMRPSPAVESGSELTEVDDEKKFKVGSPFDGEVEVMVASDSALSEHKESLKKKKVKKMAPEVANAISDVSGSGVSSMTSIREDLESFVFGGDGEKRLILAFGGRYERLILDLLMENERLKGRIDVLQSPMARQPNSDSVAGRSAASMSSSGEVAVVPPVSETWATIVKPKKETSPKEVIKTVKSGEVRASNVCKGPWSETYQGWRCDHSYTLCGAAK